MFECKKKRDIHFIMQSYQSIVILCFFYPIQMQTRQQTKVNSDAMTQQLDELDRIELN